MNVLLLEDSSDDAEILQEMFREPGKEDIRLTHATHLREALRLLDSQTFDAALVDLSLPDSAGLNTLHRINSTSPALPTVLLTSCDDDALGVQAVRMGAQDYLVKGKANVGRIRQALSFAVERHRHLVATRARTEGSAETLAQTWVLENPPRVWAGYSIVRALGEGHAGMVFLAEKHNDDGDVCRYALKIFRPSILPEETHVKLSRRFLQEAEIMAGFNHPNIVHVVEFGRSGQPPLPYIVMDYVDGKSLREFIGPRVQLAQQTKVKVLRQIADALQVIHAHKICHRDLKPDNIILTDDFTVKIGDFGIAKRPEARFTTPLKVMGTPLYMAPESFTTSDTDTRADLFSLGVLAYEFLLGQRPFNGETIPHLAQQIRVTLPLEPRKIDPALPHSLQDLLAKLLRKDPAMRVQTAGEVLAALDGVLAGETKKRPPPRHATLRSLLRQNGRDWS